MKEVDTATGDRRYGFSVSSCQAWRVAMDFAVVVERSMEGKS